MVTLQVLCSESVEPRLDHLGSPDHGSCRFSRSWATARTNLSRSTAPRRASTASASTRIRGCVWSSQGRFRQHIPSSLLAVRGPTIWRSSSPSPRRRDAPVNPRSWGVASKRRRRTGKSPRPRVDRERARRTARPSAPGTRVAGISAAGFLSEAQKGSRTLEHAERCNAEARDVAAGRVSQAIIPDSISPEVRKRQLGASCVDDVRQRTARDREHPPAGPRPSQGGPSGPQQGRQSDRCGCSPLHGGRVPGGREALDTVSAEVASVGPERQAG